MHRRGSSPGSGVDSPVYKKALKERIEQCNRDYMKTKEYKEAKAKGLFKIDKGRDKYKGRDWSLVPKHERFPKMDFDKEGE